MEPQALQYIINHLFLPPKLPQKDDGDVLNHTALLSHVLESADAFVSGLNRDSHVSDSDIECWQVLRQTLESMYLIHSGSYISAAELQMTVECMEAQDVLCLHISAQNAGVILRKFDEETTLEFFQASPKVASVTENIGKLVAQFPSRPRVSFPNDPGLIPPLCAYLAKLDCAVMSDAVPVTMKAGSAQHEIRDVADIRYISELLGGIARALTENAVATAEGTVYVTKRLNDHVYWKSALLPWRRAPKWLILKVALQTTLAQWNVEERCGYKVFITFVLARALAEAREASIPDDVLYVMNSKIGTRIQKLQSHPIVPFAMEYIADQTRSTRSVLDSHWQAVQEIETQPINWIAPTVSEIEQGLVFTLSRSWPYLSKVLNRTRETEQMETLFSPTAFEATLLQGRNIRTRGLSPPSPIPNSSADSDYWLAILDQESWVVEGLEEWLQTTSPSQRLQTLRVMITRHEELALSFKSTNPELFSRIFLTLMELWVALDKTVISLVPLLEDYSPELTITSLEPLILPELSQLNRLNDVECYLRARLSCAMYRQYSVFTVINNSSSFAARYFNADAGLQALRSEIQERASASKEAALQDWKRKHDRYHQLLAESNQLDCTFVERMDRDGFLESHHSPTCRKCSKLKEAKKQSVAVFEWPLPENEVLSRLVVFELRLPGSFGLWRDITYRLARTYSTASGHNMKPSPTPILSRYPALQHHFVPNTPANQLTIASTVKSFLVSHYKQCKMPCEIEEVIKKHPLCYDILEWTLSATTHTPNKVIAMQSKCPVELSYHEWDAFGHLRSGVRLQWRNMMLQLVTGTMTLADPVVHLLFCQAAWQAESPSEAEEPHREAHSDLAEQEFGTEVLNVLRARLAVISDNWQEGWTAATLSVVACRLLSLSRSSEVKVHVAVFLKNLRDTIWKWIGEVLRLVKTATTELESGLRDRVLQLAATCRSTYAIALDPPSLFENSKDVLVFIRCAIIIQDHIPVNLRLPEPLRYLLERDTVLSAQLLDGFAEAIYQDNGGLDCAIRDVWQGFTRDAKKAWKSLDDRWMVCTTSALAGRQTRFVYLNIVDGTLMVDGKRLGHLPRDILQHSLFVSLFPNQHLMEASPSTMKGMAYQFRQNFGSFEVHFALTGSDLVVRTWNTLEKTASEFVPAHKLLADVPDVLLVGMVHLYNESSQSLDFYPAPSGWQPEALRVWTLYLAMNPRMERCTLSGVAACNAVDHVLSPDCRVVQGISAVFRALEAKASNLLVVWRQQTPTNHRGHYIGCCLQILLPRYRLEFSVGAGGSLASEELPGLSVSHIQSAGTLFGLQNKLILQSCKGDGVKKVIIPDGDISVSRSSRIHGHEVTITPQSHLSCIRSFIYDIHDIIGRIVDDGTLTSWFLLAYLHILTSSHLPDPLLSQTGVQQALDMLESSHSFAFMQLSSEPKRFLQRISELTPVRTYYPPHLTSMETIVWHPILSPLSQSDQFASLIDAILDFANTQALFSLHQRPEGSSDSFQYKGDHALRERAEFRNSRYLPNKSTGRQIKDHLLLECTTASQDKESAVAEIANLVKQWPTSLSIIRNLWEEYRNWRNFSTGVANVRLGDPGMWLSEAPSQTWFTLLSLCGKGSRVDTYELMFALGILAYRSDINLELVRTLLVVATNTHSMQLRRTILLLPVGDFDLAPGHILELSHIQSIAQACRISYQCSPQSQLMKWEGESKKALKSRRLLAYNSKCAELCTSITELVFGMWPSPTVVWPADMSTYSLINLPSFKQRVESLFSSRFRNRLLFEHAKELQAVFDTIHRRHQVTRKLRSWVTRSPEIIIPSAQYVHITVSSLISCRDPPPLPVSQKSPPSNRALGVDGIHSCNAVSNGERKRSPLSTRAVLTRLRDGPENEFLSRYAHDLAKCVDAYEDQLADNCVCRESHSGRYLAAISPQTMEEYLQPRNISENILRDAGHWPSLGPESLLRQLSFELRGELWGNWQASLVSYAEGLASAQQQRRLSRLLDLELDAEYAKEAENCGGRGCDGMAYPDWLLIQIDANLRIRPIQISIAKKMMAPESHTNAVMQLNMGEGKSSVIVPIISAALADGEQLVRVIILKPLCAQMFQLLKQRLCGLSNRRLFYLPFNRDIPINLGMIRQIAYLFETCAKVGGILLSQPEHLLSFQLMGLYSFCCSGENKETRLLLDTKYWLDEKARDILDESDEILSVKYQLIYTIGAPNPMDGHPDRWTVLQDVFSLLKANLPRVAAEHPNDLEVEQTGDERFPRMRIYTKDCGRDLLTFLARQIVFDDGIPSISFRNYPKYLQDLALRFLTSIIVTANDSQSLRNYAGKSFGQLLLLRGLIAHGILLLSLKEKRWRVDYGLDPSRSMLAVPYRAKDSPACRAEFGHPDMILTFTCLSYYYGGLSDHQLETTFLRLFNSDNPALRYEDWIKGSLTDLPESLHSLRGLNLDDTEQKRLHIFPRLRYNKAVIDFYLSECVFPKEAREFQHKLTTNAWDIAFQKSKLTTGFSGTNDNRYLLPLSIEQVDSKEQRHTNAQVLEYLLRVKNRTVICTGSRRALDLIQLVTVQKPHVMVLLDVGAQILELQNEEVARKWLELDTHSTVQAAVYFDPKTDEPYVLSRDGRIELLASSLYKTQLDKTLVYLDEAHTRGTDFKFPVETRAVVTLGPKVTKDKLVQGCMRMRRLGSDHSVLFFASKEIWRKVQKGSNESHLDSSDVLDWAMRETCAQIVENSTLWANQGINFDVRQTALEKYKSRTLSADQFSEVLHEQESRSLDELYGVRDESNVEHGGNTGLSERQQAIRRRCEGFGTSFSGRALLEEQEREVAYEREEEREVERLVGATPFEHQIDPALRSFVRFGAMSNSFISIQDCLKSTSVPPPVGMFQSADLRATNDFYNTILLPYSRTPSGPMNNFLRTVQWIISHYDSTCHLLISPFEANVLLPEIRKSSSAFLHVYTPRVSRNTQSFEDMRFFTVPRPRSGLPMSVSTRHELNIFAGQLFLLNLKSFEELCSLLGLHLKTIPDAYKRHVDASGFVEITEARWALGIWNCAIKTSPLAFLSEFIGWRRKGQGFALTHLGQILQGHNLESSEFNQAV